ncbi:carbohydrate ABC transporter permease [Dactylosporangium sp. CA-139114]|uniref:carbohydrate ABC transporter permease n=1 Tax=Dactylosporangium sp. CA-139114 TaxID=3239931 RepID=UPI003D9686A1
MRRFTPWIYLLPALALLVVFTYVPVGSMVGYSFTDWDGLSDDPAFVGAGNYWELFTRPELFQVFFVSLYYVAASAVQIALALYFAFILSFKLRLRNLFKGIGHPVLPVPHQRRRGLVRLPVLLPPPRHPRLGAGAVRRPPGQALAR